MPGHGHIYKPFDVELRALKDQVLAMGGLVEAHISDAMLALTEKDAARAQHLIASDRAVDAMEVALDEQCIRMLALRQPAASDLRFIASTLKIVTDLERIGDLAVGIAKRALEINNLPSLDSRINLEQLASLVQKNLHAALDSFVQRDADRATAVIQADTEIDRMNATLFAELLAHVATDPATVTRVLPLTSVCRYLERIGDHVKNLAEDVVYMVSATDVRHRPIKPN